MENRTHAIIAICFLVVFSVAAVLIFIWLSSGPGEPLAYRIVTSQSVAGLDPQSKVEFKGLPVGHVTRIRFDPQNPARDRKSTRLNSSHVAISYAVFCLKKKKPH